MKFLLLLLIIGLVAFLLGFKQTRPKRRADKPAPKPMLAMVSCAECGLHLPVAEALPGRGGHFCCADHRQRYEAARGGEP
jgi:uncharacterized protein